MAENNDIEQKIKLSYSTNAEGAAKEVDKLTSSVDNSAEAIEKENTAFKSLKVQLREAVIEQQKLSAQYGSTSVEAIKATKAIAGIKDEIDFQKELVKSYNPDEKFRGLSQTAGVAALALSGVKDGFTALGIESQVLDKVIGSAQAILGVTSAVSGLGDAYAILTASQKATAVATAAATVVEVDATAVKSGSTIATTIQTAATWALNAAIAVLTSPITLVVAAVALLVAGIGYLTGAFGDFSGSAAFAKIANEKLSKSMDDLEASAKKSNEQMELSATFAYGMAKASGASAEALRKLSEQLINNEVAEKRLNAVKAQAITIEASRIASLEGASDEEKAAAKRAYEIFKTQNEIFNASLKERRDLSVTNQIAIIQDETDGRTKANDARKKASNDRKKEIEKETSDELAALKKKADDLAAKEYQSAVDAVAILQSLESPAQKEQREFEEKRAILEHNNLSIEELTVQHIDKLTSILVDGDAKEIALEQAKADQKKAIQDGQLNLADNAVGFLSKIAGKNKTLQKAAIIAESALGIGKSIIATNASNVAATASGAALGIPTGGASVAAAAGLVATNYAALGIGIAGNVAATAKALGALGGGGAASGGGGGGQSPQAQGVSGAPQVGFQASAENQIATTIAGNTNALPAQKVYVVESEISEVQNGVKAQVQANSF